MKDEKNLEINFEEDKPKKIEFLKRKRKTKSLEFYYDKEFCEKNNENDFMEEEEDMGSDLDKSGISSSSELNDDLVFGKNYLGEKM